MAEAEGARRKIHALEASLAAGELQLQKQKKEFEGLLTVSDERIAELKAEIARLEAAARQRDQESKDHQLLHQRLANERDLAQARVCPPAPSLSPPSSLPPPPLVNFWGYVMVLWV